ncbi:MAG: AmmeMemoRadiSam system protein A [Methanomassiliicoccales archaeon]
MSTDFGRGVVMGCLCPHPPAMIPEVGKNDASQTRASINGMRELAQAIKACQPECLIFLTPHGNIFADAISFLVEPVLEGNLANFGAKDINFTVDNDLELLRAWAVACEGAGLPLVGIDKEVVYQGVSPNLDHGVTVPLYFLHQAGLDDLPLIVISQSGLPEDELYQVGMCLEQACEEIGRRAVVIASGDMSHRLAQDGPYGYNPAGPEFDRLIMEIIKAGEINQLLQMPAELREAAGECGYRSLVMMAGALDTQEITSWIYSYQKPFGVGYLVAAMAPTGKAVVSVHENQSRDYHQRLENARKQESAPVAWARQVLESYINQHSTPSSPANEDPIFSRRAGVFVSLKKKGQLRGCIGTIFPTTDNVREEIKTNAVSSGTRDPRFTAVHPQELPDLVYSVDVLGEAEPCTAGDLDPQVYGVIVRYGAKTGLLLPALEGVETVDEQLRIALSKAGIKASDKYQIERFMVERYH